MDAREAVNEYHNERRANYDPSVAPGFSLPEWAFPSRGETEFKVNEYECTLHRYEARVPMSEERYQEILEVQEMADKILRREYAPELNKPDNSHYQQGGIEPIDYIRSQGWLDGGFGAGNVIKYVTRAQYKGEALKDLKKARQYLDWLIEIEEEKDDGEE